LDVGGVLFDAALEGGVFESKDIIEGDISKLGAAIGDDECGADDEVTSKVGGEMSACAVTGALLQARDGESTVASGDVKSGGVRDVAMEFAVNGGGGGVVGCRHPGGGAEDATIDGVAVGRVGVGVDSCGWHAGVFGCRDVVYGGFGCRVLRRVFGTRCVFVG
jgi:hypothetical protein